jgi:hypothetical protein
MRRSTNRRPDLSSSAPPQCQRSGLLGRSIPPWAPGTLLYRRLCPRPRSGNPQCRPQPQRPGDRRGANPQRCPPTAALPSLQRIAAAANKVLANDRNPGAYGDSVVVIGVQRPAEIVNYQSTGASPGILAAGLAVGAVVALGFTLGASVRRRRRDIALLKTLGFTRRQLAVAIAWQASVAAVVGIVLGVPTGIALGRWLWDLFARAIYAIPLPTVPTSQVILVALGALVLANVVAAVPGQMAARTLTALVLRAECASTEPVVDVSRHHRAEREGFEPSDPVSQVNSLAVSPIRPLSHLSNREFDVPIGALASRRPTSCPVIVPWLGQRGSARLDD